VEGLAPGVGTGREGFWEVPAPGMGSSSSSTGRSAAKGRWRAWGLGRDAGAGVGLTPEEISHRGKIRCRPDRLYIERQELERLLVSSTVYEVFFF
jgi:hypothetical protein